MKRCCISSCVSLDLYVTSLSEGIFTSFNKVRKRISTLESKFIGSRQLAIYSLYEIPEINSQFRVSNNVLYLFHLIIDRINDISRICSKTHYHAIHFDNNPLCACFSPIPYLLLHKYLVHSDHASIRS